MGAEALYLFFLDEGLQRAMLVGAYTCGVSLALLTLAYVITGERHKFWCTLLSLYIAAALLLLKLARQKHPQKLVKARQKARCHHL